MLPQPQPYRSSETPCSVWAPDASVMTLPPAESSSQNASGESDYTVVAASSEDATIDTSQNMPARSGTKLVGYRPLILGTFQISTPSSVASSKSRPLSSTSITPRARWPSYPPALAPISPLSAPSVPEEVASLKARLAESEAVAKDLMREKAKSLSTSRQLFTGLENLRNQKVQWAKEKDELMEKLRALDEDKATLVVSPPSEGVWFARSGKQQQGEEPQSQSASGRSTVGLSNPPLPASFRRTFLKWPRIPADPPLSGSLRQQHLRWPRIPASPLHL